MLSLSPKHVKLRGNAVQMIPTIRYWESGDSFAETEIPIYYGQLLEG